MNFFPMTNWSRFAATMLATWCLTSVVARSDSPTSQPATVPSGANTKPPIRLSADGFPAGHDSPEGAACDLARAFINRNVDLFRQACLPPFGGGDDRKTYMEFLAGAEAGIKAEAAKATPSPEGPKLIGKLFAARHLSHEGPSSTGYALYDFHDLMFVDIGVIQRDGKKFLCRTLVIQKADGKWFADPDPQANPLLSMGLNDESKSQEDFSDAYQIQK